jgi:hypothetical protein
MLVVTRTTALAFRDLAFANTFAVAADAVRRTGVFVVAEALATAAVVAGCDLAVLHEQATVVNSHGHQ